MMLALWMPMSCYFYPRPPRGGRPVRPSEQTFQKRFLSTPSARRATQSWCYVEELKDISIHALREEGDDNEDDTAELYREFLSTPSARRATEALTPRP